MTREEAIKAYEDGVPVLHDLWHSGVYSWYSHIHGYEIKHGENGEEGEKFYVILLDARTKNSTIHTTPERVFIAKRM